MQNNFISINLAPQTTKFMKNITLITFCILFTSSLFAQAPTNWIHLNQDQGYNGVSTENAYKLAKGKTSSTVIVAVLDSGVDVEHEDLKDNVWINPGEIAGNGIDDDKNGYIDDINGWNFIGGANGNVNHDTYEATRLYKKYMYKFDKANESQLSKSQMEEYKLYKKVKEEVESSRERAEQRLTRILETETTIMDAVKALETALDGKDITKDNLAALDTSTDPSLMIGVNMVMEALNQGSDIGTVENLRTDVIDQFAGAKERSNNQLEYAYNTDFDPRPVIGDDYNNQRELYYGNNDVEGPDAFHGTHVAGIIGA